MLKQKKSGRLSKKKNADLAMSGGGAVERDAGMVSAKKVFEMQRRDKEFDERLRKQIKGFLEMVTAGKDVIGANGFADAAGWQVENQNRLRVDS